MISKISGGRLNLFMNAGTSSPPLPPLRQRYAPSVDPILRPPFWASKPFQNALRIIFILTSFQDPSKTGPGAVFRAPRDPKRPPRAPKRVPETAQEGHV